MGTYETALFSHADLFSFSVRTTEGIPSVAARRSFFRKHTGDDEYPRSFLHILGHPRPDCHSRRYRHLFCSSSDCVGNRMEAERVRQGIPLPDAAVWTHVPIVRPVRFLYLRVPGLPLFQA